jgi:hydrogenase expression/formation protein HypE
MSKVVTLAHGGGGAEMNVLVSQIRKRLGGVGEWTCSDDDGAVHPCVNGNIVFTTDSYVVSPVFFPGGNIGDLAFCGTINDVCVMGAQPLGVSLALVLEEGLLFDDLFMIIDAIAARSRQVGVPVVTGDTKVMERGSVDKIVITTSGVGVVDIALSGGVQVGDCVIVSGGLAEHACSLLALRYGMKSSLVSDVQPLLDEMSCVQGFVRLAKDLTRGGLAAALNDVCVREHCEIEVEEELLPVRKEVKALVSVLGMDASILACEGRMVLVASEKNASVVVDRLRSFHPGACIVGRVLSVGDRRRVVVKTRFGRKLMPSPSGVVVPRIC